MCCRRSCGRRGPCSFGAGGGATSAEGGVGELLFFRLPCRCTVWGRNPFFWKAENATSAACPRTLYPSLAVHLQLEAARLPGPRPALPIPAPHRPILRAAAHPGSATRGACPAVNTLLAAERSVPPFRTHVYLGHERLLELNPASGEFRVLCFNCTKPCAQPANTTVPAYDVVQRGVRPDFVRAQLVALGQDELLVFQPATRSFHIRMYDRSAGVPPPPLSVVACFAEPPSATGEPFPGEPVVSGTLGDAPEAASLAYLGGGLLLAHAPGFDLGAARWALHRYDRTALGDSGGAPRALRSLGSGTWTGPRDTLQYTYVGADTLLEVNPTTCRYHLRRLVRPYDAPAPAPRCTSCPLVGVLGPGRRLRSRSRPTSAAGCSTRARCAPSRARAAACAQAAPDAAGASRPTRFGAGPPLAAATATATRGGGGRPRAVSRRRSRALSSRRAPRASSARGARGARRRSRATGRQAQGQRRTLPRVARARLPEAAARARVRAAGVRARRSCRATRRTAIRRLIRGTSRFWRRAGPTADCQRCAQWRPWRRRGRSAAGRWARADRRAAPRGSRARDHTRLQYFPLSHQSRLGFYSAR